METGIELIANERHEQIHKHGRSVSHDREVNTKGELVSAACMLLRTRGQLSVYPLLAGTALKNWDKKILKRMDRKPYLERLVIAGALIAAEIDRIHQR